ncbi:MAG: hypothetical protein L6R42_002603 [Xanthoria sp. 1 TBL-2021]|nr:MAG: hypothetical protein L6R42_002603 [Xanthoria sp. 1 TBL-2021]
MLLSSALPNHHHTLPHLQPLLIPPPLSPFDFEPRPASPALTALQSTCRSLQALITSTHHRPLPSARPPRTPTTLQSPIELRPSCDPSASRFNKVDGRNRVRKTQQTRRMRRENLKVVQTMGKQRTVMPLRVLERRGVTREGQMEAPRTPVAQCGRSPLGDVEAGRREEGIWERRLSDRADPEVWKQESVEGEAAGRRKVNLDRYDEALVGVLLRQLRLQGVAGRGR